MKKIFTTIVLLLIGIIAYSQTWKELDLDSATFHQVYGTEEEYRMQRGLSLNNKRNGGGGRVAIIGMKSYWLNELSVFIQGLGYGMGETKVVKGKYVWPYREKIATNRNPLSITVTIDTDNDERVKSIIVKGSVNAMLDLFTGYWFDPGAQRPYLSDSGAITRQFMNDKVTIKKSGSGAIITVTK